MPDYGHELLFGTFLTPTAESSNRVLALAQLTDELGLDLVTIQDHPYQARFLDTWTLLSVVASRTVNVRVAPNVANLPLRPPTVLARSVASLDILSGGRVELGLGAGAFWPAIAAMGGPHRSPAESVTALEEGIGVIRALWDTSARSVRIDGEHYAVSGAHPGPAPVHDVEIWVGAYKPRMLALTGRLADGWLPSSSYAPPETLADLNRAIDDAAEAAGRSPGAVRRLYNILGGELSAEQLAELTLTVGISAYILGSDDADDIRRFANEVAPLVRDLVERERGVESTVGEASPTERATARTVTPAAPSEWTVIPTPDDGERLSDVAVWDEATRPTASTYPPESSYAAHDMALGQHLVDVHDHLRAELSGVRDLMEQVLQGTMRAGVARSHIHTMTMRQNRWTLGTYCESYCRVVTVHHSLEDQSMLPHLRRSDAGLAPVVDRLQEEHRAIHGVLEDVDRALVAFVSTPDSGAQLRAAVDLLSDTLLSHLAYEERELVVPLARYGFA